MLIVTGDRPPKELLKSVPWPSIHFSSSEEDKKLFAKEVTDQLNACPFVLLDGIDDLTGFLVAEILESRLGLPRVSAEMVRRIDNQSRPQGEKIPEGSMYLVVPYMGFASATKTKSVKDVIMDMWDADRIMFQWVFAPAN